MKRKSLHTGKSLVDRLYERQKKGIDKNVEEKMVLLRWEDCTLKICQMVKFLEEVWPTKPYLQLVHVL